MCPSTGPLLQGVLVGSLGLSCVRGANLEGTFGKDSPLATGIPAMPATDVQSEEHRSALLDRLFDKMVTKSLNRSYLVLLPAFIPTHEYVRHFNVNSRDPSEAVRIGSRYRESAGICAVREK
jgi:hypothetical protein